MTSHGFTQKIAHHLSSQLNGDVSLVNLAETQSVNIEDYDRIIIGGSIHAGKIQRAIRQFCTTNMEQLTRKELGLFISCMYQGDKAWAQLNDAFPKELHQRAKTEAIMGGEFNFEKMNFVERFRVRKIAKTSASVHRVDKKAIQNFIGNMEQTVSTFLLLH